MKIYRMFDLRHLDLFIFVPSSENIELTQDHKILIVATLFVLFYAYSITLVVHLLCMYR